MKKWLIRCLTVLAMVCLIPGIALNAKAVAYAFTYCIQCKADKTCDILGYVWQSNADPIYHKIRIKCRTCRTENEIIYKQFSYHTGGTETPTCTTGKICRLCWSEYGILGHAWGEWSSAGNGTHIRSCTRSNCDAVDTANCTGGTATCSAKAVCVTCGAEYGEKDSNNHALEQHAAKAPTCTEKGWNAYETCSRCDYTTTYVELPALNHALEQHAAKAPTCTESGWNAYKTCSRCDYTTYAELPILGHDYQAVTVDPTCEADGYTIFTCSRCKDSYTADPTDQLGHQFGAWSPNGTGAQSADCLRQGCAHTGSTDCRKFTFRTAEGEALTFCPVCGQAENAAQLEKIEAATAWANSGSLSAEDVTARTNGEYLSVAFETAGSLTQPTGRVRLALPAGLLEGKTLVRIAPDGTQTEMPFETERGKLIYTLDFANSELPVMLFRLVPQPTAL